MISESKKNIRKKMRTILSQMSEKKVKEKSRLICDRIIGMDYYRDAGTILTYMNMEKEASLQYLIDDAVTAGKKVYIPKVISREEMHFYLYDECFSEGAYGIREPLYVSDDRLFLYPLEDTSEKILFIIPGVAYDENRNRLGHGGGYYDRYLEALTEKVRKSPEDMLRKNQILPGEVSENFLIVAAAFDEQIVDELPSDEHDKKPDMIVTDTRIIS